ncbi:MAG: PAS domain S-box protein [Gemmatimonadaceae bacterium]|nr:PAS domain S-box protein [Gemmatimonadaceae bacterium]
MNQSSPSYFTPTRVVLLLSIAVLAVAGGLLLAQAATASADARGGLWRISFVLAFVSAVIALTGAWFLSRELERRLGAELELRASRAKFEGILSIAVDAIITVDEKQEILHFNHGAETLFGYSEREMVGAPLSTLLPMRYRDAHARYLIDFARGGQVARRMAERRPIFGLRRDGSEFPAEASISRLELPGGRLFTVVLRDITERLRNEESQRFLVRAGSVLATSLDYESTLRSVAHLAMPHLADCCILALDDGAGGVRTVVSVHEDPERTKRLRSFERRHAARGNWPFPVADVMDEGRRIVQRRLADGWERDGATDNDLADALAALGIHAALTLPLVARDRVLGAITLISTVATRQFDDGEVALAEDLAHRAAFAIENARLYREAQQASRARDEILGVVSHDLRNPLSAISMCARVLLESPPNEADDRRELAEAILESTQLMQRLIQDLLDVSTIESGHLKINPRREALGPLVDATLTMVREAANERGLLIERDLPDALPEVHVDAMRLQQVMVNLVANAVKFTERGGSVTVRAEARDDSVRIAVIDTGSGIPAEHLPHIFDRYWHARRQSRTVGTGLGLAIAQGIVKAHGGSITVESTPGMGTTFIFTVPTADSTRPAAHASTPRAAVSEPPRRA